MTPLSAHGAAADAVTLGVAAATAVVAVDAVWVCPVLMAGVRVICETLGGK